MHKCTENLFAALGLPEQALLAKRIPKKQFIEAEGVTSADSRLFRDGVLNIFWQYTLKTSTCPVLPFRDNNRDYPEIAVLVVELSSQKGFKRLAEVIHRVIPYPLLLVFGDENPGLALSVAPKRFSQAEQGAYVVERFFTTDWLPMEKLAPEQERFLASLAWENLPLTDYGALYGAWTDRFTAHECAALSGAFSVGKSQERLECLNRCREIESRIAELRALLKQSDFNRQVELNTEIKRQEKTLAELAGNLALSE